MNNVNMLVAVWLGLGVTGLAIGWLSVRMTARRLRDALGTFEMLTPPKQTAGRTLTPVVNEPILEDLVSLSTT